MTSTSTTIALTLKDLADKQAKRIIINVGGKKFKTSGITLGKDENSTLAKMMKKTSPLQPYHSNNIYTFIDRNPQPFHFVTPG